MTQGWLIVIIVVSVVLGLLLSMPMLAFVDWVRYRYAHWRAQKVGDRVVARKVVTFDSLEEMEAALRKFDRGDVSALLEKRQ